MSKRIAFVAGALLCWNVGSAQDGTPLSGWYVQPQVSVGVAKQFVSQAPPLYPYGPGLHLSGGVLAGRSFGRWQAESGLQYGINKTEQETQNVSFADQFNPKTGTLAPGATKIRRQERYQHLVLPLRIGYDLTPRSRNRFRPVAGVLLSYNTRHDVLFDTNTSNDDNGFNDSRLLGNGLRTVSLWGTLGWQAQLATSRRTAIVLSGDAAYMLNSFTKGGRVWQHSFVLSFGMGFRGLF